MRISELTALRWFDIDESLTTITLKDETYTRHAQSGDARMLKGKQTSVFRIHPNLRAVLDRKRQREDRYGLIFPAPGGGEWRPEFVWNTLVKRVIEPLSQQFPSTENEIGFKDARLHSFGHFFCSLCANSGTQEPTLMSCLGRRCSVMVRYYYPPHDDESQRQMKKIAFDPWVDSM